MEITFDVGRLCRGECDACSVRGSDSYGAFLRMMASVFNIALLRSGFHGAANFPIQAHTYVRIQVHVVVIFIRPNVKK